MKDLFDKAEAAHEEAEKKEDLERGSHVEEVKETEPTNIPGAEMPAEIAAEYAKKEAQEEMRQEAPVPLEEAAPTPSDDEKSDQAPIASAANPEEKAGAQHMRLADIDDREARARQGQPVKAPGGNADSELMAEALIAEGRKAPDAGVADTAGDPDAQEEPVPAKMPVEPKKMDLQDILDELTNSGDKGTGAGDDGLLVAQPEPDLVDQEPLQPFKNPAIAQDPDELAAQEERAQFAKQEGGA